MTTAEFPSIRTPGRSTSGRSTWCSDPHRRRGLRELVLVAGLFLGYKAGRLAAAARVTEALGNGETVWRLERALHLPSEAAVQDLVLSQEWLVRLANGYYAYVHFPATAACLVWLYLRHPGRYLWTRRVLTWLTAFALLVHLLVPLAPPRLTGATGLTDTGSLYGPAVYGPPSGDALSNQYAAMPSLHVGWALVVALALMGVAHGRRRWLWLAHPLVTLSVVVLTGNHYWLDAAVAVAILAAVLIAVPSPTGARPATGAAVPMPVAQPRFSAGRGT